MTVNSKWGIKCVCVLLLYADQYSLHTLLSIEQEWECYVIEYNSKCSFIDVSKLLLNKRTKIRKYRYLTRGEFRKSFLLIPNLRDWKTHWKQDKKNWKSMTKGINRMQPVLSDEEIDILFERSLGNKALTDTVWLNNIIHVSLRGFHRTTKLTLGRRCFWDW